MITFPEFVKQHINNQVKEKGAVRIDVNVFDKDGGRFLYKHGLNFGPDLKFHGMNGYEMNIYEYLSRTLTYARRAITVCINGKLLTDIMPIALPPVTEPPSINLENTSHDTNTTETTVAGE